MQRKTQQSVDPWEQNPVPAETENAATPQEPVRAQAPSSIDAAEYDLEGLMTDFPTARDLERFVFDETGIVLNLKGRANKLKYQVAMDVLNGKEIDSKFVGSDNPYIDRADLVPEDPILPPPERNSGLPDLRDVQNLFVSNVVPHPHPSMRAQDKKVSCIFRKYKNGVISYQVLGPIEPVPHGEKIDKYGRTRPEVIKMIDPRTGEQVAVREDGTLTPQGKRLRAMMQTFRVNNTNQWDLWVDREFVSLDNSVVNNPWEIG